MSNELKTWCASATIDEKVNGGWKLVPVEPTEVMNIAARDWSIGKYGKAIGTDASEGCLTAQPTDSEMLDWLRLSGSRIERRAISTGKVEYRVIDVFGDIESTSETAREAISKAMRGEE